MLHFCSETQLVSETEVEHEVESNTQLVLSGEVEAANISVQQDKEEPSYELAIETEPSIDPGISADTSMESDDLKKIEGIGPKVVTLLKEYGIETFSQLAEIPVEELSEILDAANLHMMNPASWPQQAKLAAAGEWEALQEFQEALKGGH